MTAETLALLAPLDADGDGRLSDVDLGEKGDAIVAGFWAQSPLSTPNGPCELQSHGARLREAFVELYAVLRCPPGPLQQEFRILSVLPPGYRVVLGSWVDGERYDRFAEGTNQLLVLDRAETAGPEGEGRRGFGFWLALGVEHIFEGWDHLAFLLGLLLFAATLRRTLLLVTAFTLAHSLTLGLTALSVVGLSEAQASWVEIAIAASISYVALENLLLKKRGHRPALTFAFGLVHGFGFASVLKSYGLGDGVVSALTGFNLGVELGQAAVVAMVWPLFRFLPKDEQEARLVARILSVPLLLLGAYWVVDRLLG